MFQGLWLIKGGWLSQGLLNGIGSFKFALVNQDGSITWWSNDGSSTAGSEPLNAISLTVQGGLFSVLLGDTAFDNMTAIPASALVLSLFAYLVHDLAKVALSSLFPIVAWPCLVGNAGSR